MQAAYSVRVCVCVSSVMPLHAVCASSLKDLHGQKSRERSEWPWEKNTGTHMHTHGPTFSKAQTLLHTPFELCLTPFVSPCYHMYAHSHTQLIHSLFVLFFPFSFSFTSNHSPNPWTAGKMECEGNKQRIQVLRFAWLIKQQYPKFTSGGHCDSTYKKYPHWRILT